MEPIKGFFGEYRFLSNFWPCKMVLDGLEFPSVEHAYQAAKTTSEPLRKVIAGCKTPGEAKRAGRTLGLVRSNWDSIKIPVMESLLRQKFAKGTSLASDLIATGDALLEETNTWGDKFWGVCRGLGENHLGKLLMQIRAELISNG